jgi:signal transduction histidine kinase
MMSLRTQLAVGVSLVFLLLLGLGGGALYVSTRAALLREFDAALRVRADTLVSLTEYENGKVTMEGIDKSMPEFEPSAHAAYFEVWRADGTTVMRSHSLGTGDLPTLGDRGQKRAFWNLTLPDGRRGRATSRQFQPRVSEHLASAPSPSPLVSLVVAKERRDMDGHLRRLTTALLVVGALVMGCTVVLTSVVVHRVLTPLSHMANQAATINATTLRSRFSTSGLPSELSPVAARLNDLLARLEQSFERERRFTADAAHELRTTIAELRTLAEVALKWPEDKEATSTGLRDTLAIAQRMETLVTGLLTLARCEAGKQSLDSEGIPLAPLVQELCTPLAEQVRRKQLGLHVEIPTDARLDTNRALLRLILANLVDNAIEYTPTGGDVRIVADRNGGRVGLSVSNTTTDLDARDIPRLFERFWRKDPARTASEHSGLGLSLAQAAAVAIGFRLTAALTEPRTLVVTLTAGGAGETV